MLFTFHIMLPTCLFFLHSVSVRQRITLHRIVPQGQGGGRVQLDAYILFWASRNKDAEWERPWSRHAGEAQGGPRAGAPPQLGSCLPRGGDWLYSLSSRAENRPGAGICHENRINKHIRKTFLIMNVFPGRKEQAPHGARIRLCSLSNWQLQGCQSRPSAPSSLDYNLNTS